MTTNCSDCGKTIRRVNSPEGDNYCTCLDGPTRPETIAELQTDDNVKFVDGNGVKRDGQIVAVRENEGRLRFEIISGLTSYVANADDIKSWHRSPRGWANV
jgi:hypothetical protein